MSAAEWFARAAGYRCNDLMSALVVFIWFHHTKLAGSVIRITTAIVIVGDLKRLNLYLLKYPLRRGIGRVNRFFVWLCAKLCRVRERLPN